MTYSLKILLVEDEAIVATDIGVMLEETAHHILGEASSVDAALFLLKESRPDVALLDVNLQGRPVMSVVERCKCLGIPFLLISDYETFDFDRSGILERAENTGKPVFKKRLLDGLQKAVRQRQT